MSKYDWDKIHRVVLLFVEEPSLAESVLNNLKRRKGEEADKFDPIGMYHWRIAIPNLPDCDCIGILKNNRYHPYAIKLNFDNMTLDVSSDLKKELATKIAIASNILANIGGTDAEI